ncbi:MAG TPA: 50S ribosome-binding GTPase [Candidatus Ozemobacteraceae bacterium]|nr:50S ribosome-binding GTPase [Candidatus Ozemobacteraceae bacterium]HQG27603.1 50S ribosome-binding GTPase [Candidatus Ozemobacteraceae bacterium]
MTNATNRDERRSDDSPCGIRRELDLTAERLLKIAEEAGVAGLVTGRIRAAQSALAEFRPAAMLFGCYNAGKSTLLNALLKKEQAPVSDVPCTAALDEYKFADWTLYDTPGIDAPIEHEELTREHLRRCHVIVLVVSTAGGTEEELTLRELKRLQVDDKEIIVVLNNKTGLQVDETAVNTLRSRIRDELGNPGVPSVPVLLVNAKSALRGCEPGKEALYEASGIADLLTELPAALARSGGMRVLVPGLNLLRDAAASLSAALREKDASAEARRLEENLKAIRRARAELDRLLEADLKALRGELENRLEKDFAEGGTSRETIEWYLGRSESCLKRRVDILSAELGEAVSGSGATLAADASELPRTPTVVIGGDEGAGRPSETLPAKSGVALDMNQLPQLLKTDAAKSTVKDGLLTLRSYGIPGIKGRWTKTLDKWAGKITRGAGIAIQVFLAAKEYRDAQRAQAAYEQSVAEARRELRHVACQQAGEIEQSVLNQAADVGKQLFSPLEQQAMAAADSLGDAERSRIAALERTENLRTSIDAIHASVAEDRDGQ